MTTKTTISTTTPRRPARTAARVAGLVLAASSAFGTFAGVAHADTPPAPKPVPPLAIPAPGPIINLPWGNPPPGPNYGRVNAITAKAGDVFADVSFRSNRTTVMVQFSTTKPYWKDGALTMGPVSPMLLHGTPVAGDVHDKVKEQQYQFTFSPEGLTPNTKYYVLYTVNGTVTGQQPFRTWSEVTTKKRYVRMTPLTVHVSDDADGWARGDGEIAFASRVAPDAGPTEASIWSDWTKEYSLGSGDDLDLSKSGMGQTVQTELNHAWVQIQGRENDDDGAPSCPIEGGEQVPEQYSDGCFDWAVAEGYANLPTQKYPGLHEQVVQADVHRGPALEFQVKVLVQTWYGD